MTRESARAQVRLALAGWVELARRGPSPRQRHYAASMIEAVVVTLVTVGGALVVARLQTKLVPHRRRRDTIEHDLRIWKELPTESATRSRLLAHIDSRVEDLITIDRRRRDWQGIVGGLVFVLLFTTLALSWGGPSWGRWIPEGLAATSFILGSFIIWESWGRVERDESGARIVGTLRPLRRRRAVIDEMPPPTPATADL